MSGAKPATADVQMTVGGKAYTLRYSVRALAALQDHFRLASLTAVQQRLSAPDSWGARDIVAIIWAGLQTHHRDLTMDDVMDLVDEAGLDAISSVAGAAFDAAAPPEDGASADPR